MTRTKEQLLFLAPEDEALFFARIRDSVPDVRLIDGSRWPSPRPPVVGAPGETQERILFLWSPSVRADLPCRLRGEHYDGPATVWVVQWVRSVVSDDELRSGRLEATWDPSDAVMSRFVATVWKTLRAMTTNRLTRADGVPDATYRVGPTALQKAHAGHLDLRDGSVPVYLRVST